MDSNETKEDESQGTDKDVEKSHAETELDKVESSNVASSTTDESYPAFEVIKENVYLGNKKKRVNKEIRRMSCDCPYSPEEHEFIGCGDDCLNRLLMIECNNRCPCGESCSNRKFQEGQKVEVVAFKTLKKGWGLRTLEDISANQFVMEYCGEVMGYEEFEKRVEVYDKENRRHYYFMTLRADEIIDATHKGNLSRFINHSCSPNCETQKWTVNGYLRIGFFSIKDIKAGTELTFDYKFQRYGKKAQICYCESPNCRGIIGGEKHTPLKSIISGRAVSPARTSSPRRNRRRRLVEQWDDKPLEIEISQLLAGEKGIRTDEQALKLSQFMVRAETPQQRILLLDTLLATDDQNCLRSFLRYQGMLLLWSWMVDLGENSLRFQKKIVHVLKHLPVANLNQVKDTKVLKVISKWARKPSVSCVPEEDTSSSDVDSRGRSPFELQDDTGRREGDVISSSVDTTFVREDLQNACKPLGMDIQSVTGPVVDNSLDMSKIKALDGSSVTAMETEGGIAITITSETEKHDETTEDDSVFKPSEVKTDAMRLRVEPNRTVSALMVDTPGIGDSSEEESRWSEDDAVSTDSEGIVDLAADLLDTWSSLKEVYRIPKKSTIVVKREPESTSGESEAVVSEPSNTRVELKIPVMPTIEGDLFQKDEFLSKLGERELVDRKPFQQDSTVNPSDVPPPINTSVLTTSEPDEGSHDTNKLPIHQRLQMVATGGNAPKQYPIWHAKAGRRARKHPYNAGGGAFQSGPDKWAPRNQAGGKPRFNHPLGCGPNLPMHPGGSGPPRPNMGSNQWQAQSSSSYPGGYQYPSGGCQQPSAQPSYPASTPNQGTVRPPSSYFPSSGAQHIPPGDQNPYQTPYSAPASRGSEQSPYIPGSSQLPAQPAVQTSPSGYQQIQQPVTQSHFPPFDPSKPPPNFVPSQGNLPPRQFASTTQFQNTSSQFRNVPPTYSTSPTVPGAPNYPLSTPRMHPQVGSQAPVRPIVEQPQVIVSHRHPNTASMVSSSVSETEAMDRGKIDIRGKSDTWLTESHGKSHDVPLPPDWKMAYDGEGRAYYYHVVTRQTQWEPPIADRSPPTPEIGYLGDELDSSLEMTATFPPQITTGIPMGVVDPSHSKKPKTPSTPPGSPPTSPVGRKYTTAAADTTDVRKGMYSPSSLLQGHHLTPEQRKCRETFRMKLSAVVVNYLNPYHKLDCKVGRITSVDDFKFLARKLTHGVMVKELSHLKDESSLACNDSVKIKTKEYIRHYMQKFGPVYKPS